MFYETFMWVAATGSLLFGILGYIAMIWIVKSRKEVTLLEIVIGPSLLIFGVRIFAFKVQNVMPSRLYQLPNILSGILCVLGFLFFVYCSWNYFERDSQNS